MARITAITLFASALLLGTANAQFGGWGGGFNGGDGDGRPPWDGGDDGDGDNGSGSGSSGSINQGSLFSSPAEFNRASRVLIIHAVLASAVWVIFIPSFAILLRLNIKNPIVLKTHAIAQILSYVIYVVAAGMGIWLAQQSAAYGIWNDPHPKVGIAILVIGFFQPIFGAVHHRIYKKRATNVAAGRSTKAPGRTAVGRIHLWVGRILILLGVINGGLGIRLASASPFQTESTSQKAGIAYGVIAAVMFLLYVLFVVAFEIKRARHQDAERVEREQTFVMKDSLPSYDESEESVSRSNRHR